MFSQFVKMLDTQKYLTLIHCDFIDERGS